MADFYLKSGSGALEMQNRAWSVGDRMVPARADTSTNNAVAKRWVWECTTSGTSTGTPTWPSSVTQDTTTVTQNGVVWTARKPGFSSGSTADWSFATIYMDYAASAMSAGDRLFISSSHSETVTVSSGTYSITFPGTLSAVNQALCVNDGAAPPTSMASGAIIKTSSPSNGLGMTLGGSFYMHGVTLSPADGQVLTGVINMGTAAAKYLQNYKTCTFRLPVVNASTNRISIGCADNTSNSSTVHWDGCTVDFSSSAAAAIKPNVANWHWNGGSIINPSTTLLDYTSTGGHRSRSLIENVDASGYGSGRSLANIGALLLGDVVFRQVKTGSGYSLTTGTWVAPGGRVILYNCGSGDTNYQLNAEGLYGTIADETTRVRSGGASDGDTPIAWLMTTTADAHYPIAVLESPEIARRFPGTDSEVAAWTPGASVTVTVEILHDSAIALKDDEVWLEVQCLGTNGYPLGVSASDCKTDPLATAADQAASSEAWTTTGMSNPHKQKLSVTIAPYEKGTILAKVVLAKASKSIYVDPITLVLVI